jgi:hypothetical protein
MKSKIDISGLTKKVIESSKLKKEVMKKALPVFVGYTPIRTGNARNSTYLKKDTIVADYPYASYLDEGSSKQAPRGMTIPTKKEMVTVIKLLVKKGLK